MKKIIDSFVDMILELLNIFQKNPVKLASNMLNFTFWLLVIAWIWGLDDRKFICKLILTVLIIDIPLYLERKRIKENEKTSN